MLKANCNRSIVSMLLLTVFFGCKDDDKSEPAAEEPIPSIVVSGENPDSNSGSTGSTPIADEPPVVPPPALVPPQPVLSIELTNHPADPSFNNYASFTFTARNFTASTYSCSIDGAAFASCVSPYNLPNLSAGQHVLTVKSSGISTTFAWTVDQTIEKMPITPLMPTSSLIQDFAEIDGSIYFATNQGLVISRDGGKTVTVRDASSGMPTRFTYKLEIVGEKLFIATQQGLVVSNDLGVTLQNKTTANGLHNNFIGWIYYDRKIDRLYALHITGMSYSDDGGATFTPKTTFTGAGVTGFTQMFVTADGRVYLLGTNSTIYSASSLDGTYAAVKSSVSRMFVTQSGKFYAASSTGLHYSTDNGQTILNKQMAAGLPSNTVYSVEASEDGKTIIVGTNTGYAYSFDGGETFTSGSISAHTGGGNSVGRVIFSASGQAMISDQTTPTLTAFQMRDSSRTYTDFTAPEVSKNSFVNTSSMGSGVGMSWTQATDAVTEKSKLVYEIFGSTIGADFSDLTSIYLNGDVVARHQGLGTAPVYLAPDTDKQLALVVTDSSGNKTAYTAVNTGSASTALSQSWSQETADGGIGKLIDHRVVKKGNLLYMVGGVILDPMPITVQNKVYSTLDGKSWSTVAQTGDTAERADHGLVSFADKLWISGGYDSNGFPKGDVASSTNGATWPVATGTAAFGPRRGHGMVVFKNQMWVIGGNAQPAGGSWSMKSDAWSSSDGVTWQKATETAGFKPAAKVSIVATADYMYFLGEGTDTSVWRTANGTTWEKILEQRPTGTNFSFAALIHGNEIYTIGGSKTGAGVWKSPDGVIWESVSTGSTIPEREDHTAISYLDKIWLYQGINAGYKADIWSGQ